MKSSEPKNETARLKALYRYKILDTPPEEAFDDITNLAKHICETPVALISLVDGNRQWFKSKVGLDVPETPLDVSFCVYAIQQPSDLFIVPDALADERFTNNRLVISSPNIRFYAGMPLVTPEGHALGTLCVIDVVPKELSPEQKEALRALGRQVVMQLELRRSLAERSQAEEALRERTNQILYNQRVLLELAKMDNSDLEMALKRITEVGSKTLGVERVSVWLYNEGHSEIICKNLYKLSEDSHEDGLRLKAEDYPSYFEALEERRTLAADDARTDPRTCEFTEGYLIPCGINSMMDVPIRLRGEVIGIVCHEHIGLMREWTIEEQDFAASIADMASLAFEASERKRVEGALQKARDELEIRVIERTSELVKTNEALRLEVAGRRRKEDELRIVNSITQAMNESLELEEIYRIALDKITEQEYVDLACIYLVDESRNEAVMQDQRNFPQDYVQRAGRIPYPKGVTWKVINTGEILNVKDAREDPDVGPAGRDIGFRSKLGIPIALEGKTIGVLWLHSYKEHQFTKPLEDFLISIGRQIAIAVARANLYRDLSKKNRYETIISAVTQNVHRSINIQDVLENAVDAMSKNIDRADIVSIYFVEGEEAVIKSYRGLTDQYIRRAGRIPRPKGFTWKAIMDERPMYCADVDKDTVIGPAGRELGIKSYLSMPIRFGERAVGCININSFEKDAFDEEELKLLQIVAQQIETAINNAKQAEVLRQSEERYKILFDQSPVGVYMFDKDFKITQCNECMSKILKSSRDKITGLDMKKLKDQGFMALMKKALEGETCQQEGFYEATTSLAKLWLSVCVTPLRDSEGNVTNGIAVVEDITERKRAEEELLKAQKLESLGVLAGGIAHDFNNLLTAILGNVSLIKTYGNPENKTYKRLTESERACFRARDLTQQLLTFSKGGAPVKRVTSIVELIKESVGFATRGSNAVCEFSLPEHLWAAEVDEGQISQVINNLVLNAQQAMPGGGVIKIRAENVKKDGLLSLHYKTEGDLPIKDGRYVRITVEDHGIGIPEEHLSKVFDPYFTTKQKGSGLGLVVAYSIINNHNGYVGVESTLGAGTKFYIYLPASNERVSERVSTGEEGLMQGKGKILVMDDEEVVRGVAGDMLSQIGYEVEFAGDGTEAIDLYRRAKEGAKPFDVVIMDLTVPGGMGGKETLRRLLDIDPGVKAVVSSGYSNDPVMSEHRKYGFIGVVSKPYEMGELSKVVHKVMNGK